ncbi:unnamed protein product [Periconia digitata]|uniref:Uncharacterized protein n=1 Tax=Periconia digitata TaxID=1303443 RepID=A0A9W4XJT0_9PLEO|nr:unnamed protein product [Periconia digitata]
MSLLSLYSAIPYPPSPKRPIIFFNPINITTNTTNPLVHYRLSSARHRIIPRTIITSTYPTNLLVHNHLSPTKHRNLSHNHPRNKLSSASSNHENQSNRATNRPPDSSSSPSIPLSPRIPQRNTPSLSHKRTIHDRSQTRTHTYDERQNRKRDDHKRIPRIFETIPQKREFHAVPECDGQWDHKARGHREPLGTYRQRWRGVETRVGDGICQRGIIEWLLVFVRLVEVVVGVDLRGD